MQDFANVFNILYYRVGHWSGGIYTLLWGIYMFSVIDKKSDSHSFGRWPLKEQIDTTLTLVETDPGVFGLYYEVNYSGIRGGNAQGGPIAVSGNVSSRVTEKPVPVDVQVSNYSNDTATSTISMHITIIAHSGVIGDVTLYDQTLGGKYQINVPEAIVTHIHSIVVQ